jgi:hypothetical protein
MKKKLTTAYVLAGLIAITMLAAAYLNRIYISPSEQENNITVELKWIFYDAEHVAIEYDINGVIQTQYGDYTDCPIGVSEVSSTTGKNIAGETYTSCRFISEGRYSVTQFFYNDFQDKTPKNVKIRIGDITFFSDQSGEEIHIPLLKTFTFNLPDQPSSKAASFPSQAVEANGIEMFVSRADFTPRLGKVDACLTLPDNGDWGIDAYIVMGDETIPIDYWEIPDFRNPETLQNNKRCFTTVASTVPDFREIKPGEISFVVNKIYRNMPDCTDAIGFEKIKGELDAYGITIEPDPAGYYCFSGPIVDLGDSSANAHLFSYIQDALKEEVEGPLTVTIK